MDLLSDKPRLPIHKAAQPMTSIQYRLDLHRCALYHSGVPDSRQPAALERLLAQMDSWPRAWAGVNDDERVGHALLAHLKAFVVHLHTRKLSVRTLQRHIDNAWCIGGEVIRQLHDEPRLRSREPHQLLLESVAGGEAPLVHQLSVRQQERLDATARKLFAFLSAP